MNNYEITILILFVVKLVLTALTHGKERKAETVNFYKVFFYTLINLWLFYMAGLFVHL